MDFGSFILLHQADDVARLALQRGQWESQVEDPALALTTLEARQKLRYKLPEWYACPALQYPSRLSAQQCSSSVTATYKASLTSSLGAARIADLTGGLGVDSWAFSRVASAVLYNEVQDVLVAAARHNFPLLGAGNILIQNRLLESGKVREVLGDFAPDLVFLDPARRGADGRKVFKLEDCQPDVLQLRDELLAACPRLLLKLSPMADISLVYRQLGCVKAVHVVAAEGECKELLLLLEKGCQGPYSLTVFDGGCAVDIPRNVEPAQLATSVLPGQWLFEPGKALCKAGAFDWPGAAFGLAKMGRHTHLYLSDGPVPPALRPFGKCFEVQAFWPLDKAGMKQAAASCPAADVSAHNIPLSSDALRARLGVRSGGGIHLFGAQLDALGRVLIAAKPLS